MLPFTNLLIEGRNHIDDLPDLTRAVSAVSCDKILGLVLFNLPGKNKLVGPSPILESGEILVYQKDYIDSEHTFN